MAAKVEQECGTAILTCKNHPTYRWTKTKYGPGFIGRGVLMFDGEEGGKPNCCFNMSESTLREQGPAYEAHYREAYTPECDCPVSDLIFLRWYEEVPIESKAQADAFITELGTRMKDDAARMAEFG